MSKLVRLTKEDQPVLTLAHARRLLEEHRPAHARNGYPPDVRNQVTGLLLTHLDAGAPVARLARELGISPGTVTRWTDQEPGNFDHHGEAPATFLPLPVAAAPPTGLTVTTPAGLRVDGLDLPQVVALLQALG